MPVALGAALLLGCGRSLLTHPPVTERDLEFYNGPEDGPKALVVGVVSAEAQVTDRSQRIRVSAEGIQLPGDSVPRPVRGDVLAVVSRYPEREVGARVALSGTLTTPPNFDTFDYAAYLARQGLYSYMLFPRVTHLGAADVGTAISGVRSRVRDALRRGLPEPHAALAVGVVTGDRTSISEEVREAFVRSGAQHILAISGQNIALLVGFVYAIYGLIIRRRLDRVTFGVVVGLLITYTFFTGVTPSVVRAAAMGALLLFAPIAGRRADPLTALAVAATVMTLFDPDTLADVGFQLSFAAMAGIVFLAPYIYEKMKQMKAPTVIALSLSVSLGAQVATLPLVLFYTGKLSVVSLLATLTADIALLPLMLTGIITGIVGSVIPPLAPLFGLAVWPCAAWLLWWVEFWGGLPWASFDVGRISPLLVLGYYLALAWVVWLLARRRLERLYAA